MCEAQGILQEIGLMRQLGVSLCSMINVSKWHVRRLLFILLSNTETVKDYLLSAANDLSGSILIQLYWECEERIKKQNAGKRKTRKWLCWNSKR